MSTWTLKALGADDCDIPLDFSGSSSVTVGRRDLRTCSEANHVSSQHLEFHTCMSDASALVVIARSKFDVVFVHGKLLAKDQIDFVQNGTIISMCGKLFSYTLRRHINASTIKLETKTKKRKIDETIDFAPNSCASANDMRDPPPQCGSELAEASAAMALEDVLSAVYNRSHTAFANTRSLARELLSSFQCDICLELIAGSRSCVPCGHSFCVACITNYMAVKRQGASTCPNCRGKIQSIIPNKLIDSAISDCLKSIKDAARAVAITKRLQPTTLCSASSGDANAAGAIATSSSGMRTPDGYSSLSASAPLVRSEVVVTESQDIDAWEIRYKDNENASKIGIHRQVHVVPAIPPVVRGLYSASYAVEYSPNDDDDEDDDDEDDDGEDDEFGDGIDCSNPLVEHARSGRSTCIHCNTLIAFGALRFGVTQFTQEIYRHDRDMTRFLHVTCGRSYNHYRRSIGANTISLLNMHSLNNLSNSDRRIVESSI